MDRSELAGRFPLCKHLWSKKRFFASLPPASEAELLDGSQACWCALTHQALGPDRRVADPDHCRAGRDCHVGVLEGGAPSWRALAAGGTMPDRPHQA